MSQPVPPGSAAEALGMLRSAMGYLSAADATTMAAGYTAWARRTATHPQVVQALAEGEMSESFGRAICTWTDKLPRDCRAAADEILLAAAAAGMGLRDLAGLRGS